MKRVASGEVPSRKKTQFFIKPIKFKAFFFVKVYFFDLKSYFAASLPARLQVCGRNTLCKQ